MNSKSRSQILTAYNKARARKVGLDPKRINRALGLVQAGKVNIISRTYGKVRSQNDPTAVYVVNHTRYGWRCTCPDRWAPCKHKIAFWIELRAAELPVISVC